MNRRFLGLPLWIVVYTVLITLPTTALGMVGGFTGNPALVIKDFMDLPLPDAVLYLAGMWGSKNAAYLVLFIGSFALKEVRIFAAMNLMKFINDSLDILLFQPIYLDASVNQIVISYLVMTVPLALIGSILLRNYQND